MASSSRSKAPCVQSTGKSDAVELYNWLRAEVEEKGDIVEPGYKPLTEWAKDWGVSKTGATRLLLKGESSGKVLRKKFRVRSHSGHLTSLSYFKMNRTA